jgi:hypothetical protein
LITISGGDIGSCSLKLSPEKKLQVEITWTAVEMSLTTKSALSSTLLQTYI